MKTFDFVHDCRYHLRTYISIRNHVITPGVAVVFMVSITIVSGLSQGSAVFVDSVNAFAQEQQNQTATAATSGNNTNTTIAATSTYDEMLNPRQTEYPALLGFNDLHIEAIRHIDPNATQAAANQSEQELFNLIVHHHCKLYDDMTAACLLFPTGMNDQDKPYGIEYVIPTDQMSGSSKLFCLS
jgi:hypothetical protein